MFDKQPKKQAQDPETRTKRWKKTNNSQWKKLDLVFCDVEFCPSLIFTASSDDSESDKSLSLNLNKCTSKTHRSKARTTALWNQQSNIGANCTSSASRFEFFTFFFFLPFHLSITAAADVVAACFEFLYCSLTATKVQNAQQISIYDEVDVRRTIAQFANC